jgi:hypothetical protein
MHPCDHELAITITIIVCDICLTIQSPTLSYNRTIVLASLCEKFVSPKRLQGQRFVFTMLLLQKHHEVWLILQPVHQCMGLNLNSSVYQTAYVTSQKKLLHPFQKNNWKTMDHNIFVWICNMQIVLWRHCIRTWCKLTLIYFSSF